MIVIKNNDSVVDQSLSLPQYVEFTINCKPPSYLQNNLIRDNLPKDALSRLQANDVAGAIEILNCNSNSKSTIVDSLIQNIKDQAHNEQLK